MSSFPPGCDIAPALTPSRQTTHRHLATVALETRYRCSTVASSPTVQVREEPTHDVIRKRSKLSNYLSSYWLSLQRTAAGARGLHSGHAQSPVGWGFSCQKGNVIAPPLDMEAKSAKGRALRARFVRVHVQVTHTHTDKHLEPWTATHSVMLLLKVSLLRLVHASWTSEQDPCLLML